MGKQWRIEGVDGTTEIFSRSVPNVEEAEMRTILQRLACRHLTEDEIVSASLRRNMKDYRDDLVIRRMGGKCFGLMTTGTPCYIASLQEAHDS